MKLALLAAACLLCLAAASAKPAELYKLLQVIGRELADQESSKGDQGPPAAAKSNWAELEKLAEIKAEKAAKKQEEAAEKGIDYAKIYKEAEAAAEAKVKEVVDKYKGGFMKKLKDCFKEKFGGKSEEADMTVEDFKKAFFGCYLKDEPEEIKKGMKGCVNKKFGDKSKEDPVTVKMLKAAIFECYEEPEETVTSFEKVVTTEGDEKSGNKSEKAKQEGEKPEGGKPEVAQQKPAAKLRELIRALY